MPFRIEPSDSLPLQRANRLHLAALSEASSRTATSGQINRSAEDPASLIAADRLRATLQTLDAEARALQRTSQIARTADGALATVSGLLQDLDALVRGSANDAGRSPQEKRDNQIQVDSILDSLDRISAATSFGELKLLDGSARLVANGHEVALDSTAAADLGKTEIDRTGYNLAGLRSGGALSSDPAKAAEVVAAAIQQVATLHGRIGDFEGQTIDPRLGSISASMENAMAAVSLITDADLASENSQVIREELLKDATMKVIATNGQTADIVLSLLRPPPVAG